MVDHRITSYLRPEASESRSKVPSLSDDENNKKVSKEKRKVRTNQ